MHRVLSSTIMEIFHFFLLCAFLANGSVASEINNCLPNPCLNNGTCVDGDDGYTCRCTPIFTGLNCTETCLALWTPFNGSCYRFDSFHYDWWNAQISCRYLGGTLVEITSAEENTFLVNLRVNVRRNELLHNFYYEETERNAWIGLKYKYRKRNYVWDSSGNLANFTNWENGHQINGLFEGNCVEMSIGGEWTRSHCLYAQPFFCERPVIGFRYCSQELCRNGGTCFDVEHYYSCLCPPDYIGPNCEEFNNCHPNPCVIGATCEDRDNGYTCICIPGYTGYNCTESYHCFPNPCLNGSTCIGVKDNYTCSCRPNFSGRNCEEFDSCSSNPCENGGTCVDGENDYICKCTDGFTGEICNETCPAGWVVFERSCYSFNADPLDWNSANTSCINRGGNLAQITHAAENDFLVKLRDEAEKINNCLPNPCLNNGTGVDGDDGCTCSCTHLFTGLNCTETCLALWTPFNGSCYRFDSFHYDWWNAQISCRYLGGTLVEITSAEENTFLVNLRVNVRRNEMLHNFYYEETERNAWIGLKYQDRKRNYVWDSSGNLANFTNWENGHQSSGVFEGNCVEMSIGGEWTRSHCLYAQPFFCERPVIGFRYCSQEPCRNGGTCFDVGHYYSCSCPPEFIGPNCEEFNNCHPNPCVIGATCEDRGNGYTCICIPGFTGYNCTESYHCFPNPCLNGSTCIGVKDNYTCSCRPNFSGRNCEEFDSCSSNPCENGGTCVDGENDYICKCTDGFTGEICNETCPAGWVVFERSCYSFNADPLDWNSANTSCINRGGNLVQITHAAENDFLVKLRDEAESTYKAWIGLKMTFETTPTRTWILSAGDVAKFTYWENGQPSGNGYCAEMWLSGKWSGLECESSRPYYCERSTIDAI